MTIYTNKRILKDKEDNNNNYNEENKYVLSCDLNVSVEDSCRSCRGSLFQSFGPVAENARLSR